jgi:hypothetical protein
MAPNPCCRTRLPFASYGRLVIVRSVRLAKFAVALTPVNCVLTVTGAPMPNRFPAGARPHRHQVMLRPLPILDQGRLPVHVVDDDIEIAVVVVDIHCG